MTLKNWKYSISSITYIDGDVNIALSLAKVKKPIHCNTYIVERRLIMLTFTYVTLCLQSINYRIHTNTLIKYLLSLLKIKSLNRQIISHQIKNFLKKDMQLA